MPIDNYSDLGAVAVVETEEKDYSDLGAVPADTVEIRKAPDQTLFQKATSVFIDPKKRVVRSQNVFAISEATGIPRTEVNKHYDALRYSSEVTGINSEMDKKEFLSKLMIPGIVAAAVANPVGTAVGVITFGIIDKVIPTDKLIKKMEAEGVSDDVVQTIEMIDFIGKALLTHKAMKQYPKVGEIFTKSKITKYKMPETMTLTGEQVKDIFQTGKLTTAEQKSMFASLGLNSHDMRAALKHGTDIRIPTEKIVTITDRPYWSKIKGMFGKPPVEPIITKTAPGKPAAIKQPVALIEGAIEPVTPPKIDPVKQMTEALKKAKDLRKQQETLLAKGRAKQFAKMLAMRAKGKGEKGFFKELGALKGELQRVEFESIRDEVGQEGIDSLFNMIKETPKIGEWEKLTAQSGLSKIFGEEGGKVPTKNEIKLLNEVYGEEFTKTLMSKRTMFQKFGYAAKQIISIPKAIMASYDLSAPLRQGIFFVGRPKQFIPSFAKMFKQFVAEKAYNNVQDAIITHPDYQLARESKLSLTDLGDILSQREEQFMSSWAEKIPLVGKGIRASNRAYTGFLNKLRYDVFTDLISKAETLGLDPRNNRDLTRGIAGFINNATGRGTLPRGMENMATNLNTIFFSPRLIASRLNLVNPVYYIKQQPFVRKEALKSLFTFVGAGLTVLTLAKLMGAEVGDEPRSSDFGKIRIGNTRIDVWGGFQPLVRSAAQLITGKYISSTTGKELTLGEGYKPMTRADIVQRFIEGKLAPVPSFIMRLLKQQDIAGAPVSVPKEISERFIPMVMQDIYDLHQEDPKLLPLGLMGIFGVGIQTYKDRKRLGF